MISIFYIYYTTIILLLLFNFWISNDSRTDIITNTQYTNFTLFFKIQRWLLIIYTEIWAIRFPAAHTNLIMYFSYYFFCILIDFVVILLSLETLTFVFYSNSYFVFYCCMCLRQVNNLSIYLYISHFELFTGPWSRLKFRKTSS